VGGSHPRIGGDQRGVFELTRQLDVESIDESEVVPALPGAGEQRCKRPTLERRPGKQLEALFDLGLGHPARPLQSPKRREDLSVDVGGGEQPLIAQPLLHRLRELGAAEQIDDRRGVDDDAASGVGVGHRSGAELGASVFNRRQCLIMASLGGWQRRDLTKPAGRPRRCELCPHRFLGDAGDVELGTPDLVGEVVGQVHVHACHMRILYA